MTSIKATIYYKSPFWVGRFERIDKEGYSGAEHIFGSEPSDQEVYNFVLQEFDALNFGGTKEFHLEIHRMNPKRLQREVRKEMERVKLTTKPSSFAQDYMREELEKNKKLKKQSKRARLLEKKQEQFALRQKKRKEKQKGH